MYNDLGLSGCKLKLFPNNIIRKYSSNRDYNNRLIKQINKQNFFNKHIFTNIDTPKVIKEYYEEIVFFDMEYIIGCDYYEYFSKASLNDLEKILLFLDEYFHFLIENSQQYENEIIKYKIKNKLLGFKDSNYNSEIKLLLKYLDKINLDVRKSFCHGDLTISNMLFHTKKIYLIDFLDSYIDTFIIDLIKLKQDLYYYWILEINNTKNTRIIQCFNFIWKYIEKKYNQYVNSDIFFVLEFINFLRIEPYLTNNKQTDILNNIIKKTTLYEKFACSNGR